jgi:signal transduction histidine kinase
MSRSGTSVGSIRWRFTLWISAVLIVSVGISYAIIYNETGTRLRAQITHQVIVASDQLAQSLRLIDEPSPAVVAAGGRRYMSAQPFASVATLLFVLIPGRSPVSNYPELLSATTAPDDGESPPEQSAENAQTATIREPHLGLSTRILPDVGSVLLSEQRITIGGRSFVVAAGQPLSSVAHAQRGVIHSFVFAGVFIALAVLLGSAVVGARVTAPLRRMARVAARVDGGDLQPRMETGGHDEVGVLATTFNHMLERLNEAFQGQREFIADASHELRTPLTVVQGQLEVLAHRDNPDPAEVRRVERLVNREIQRMRRIVDDLLLLAQSERPDFLKLEPLDLARFVSQLQDDATLIADRRFELGEIPSGRLLADPDRLAQALRNLITNAIDHTAEGSGTVRLEARSERAGEVTLAVLDDGPGVPPAELDRIFQRFHRSGIERAGQFGGAGLGLAIVRAIADAHGGTVSASNGGIAGGARFELRLPGFTPVRILTPT